VISAIEQRNHHSLIIDNSPDRAFLVYGCVMAVGAITGGYEAFKLDRRAGTICLVVSGLCLAASVINGFLMW
jgi:hypothetical protein